MALPSALETKALSDLASETLAAGRKNAGLATQDFVAGTAGRLSRGARVIPTSTKIA